MTRAAVDESVDLPSDDWCRRFVRLLKRWFRQHGRDLPWRADPSPYQVWVSEVMLQQTQVATVLNYYHRFLERFPDATSLAAADEAEVLRHWEGLGYYRRARQLHQAAQQLVAEHAGELPADVNELQRLPGVGRYTASAIRSLACDESLPILEANTQRLYARLLAYDGDLTRAAGQRLLWSFAERLVPRRGAGDFNQALMDLGSQVCTPRSPACPSCPVRQLCEARLQGRQDSIPRAAQRPEITLLQELAVVLRHGHHVLLRRCPDGERWAGLWDFPRFPVPPSPVAPSPVAPSPGDQTRQGRRAQAELARQQVRDATGIDVPQPEYQLAIRHSVTRYRIELAAFSSQLTRRGRPAARPPWKWVSLTDLAQLPLSVTGRKLAQRLLSGEDR